MENNEQLPRAISESVLSIGGIEIPCAVLDDGRRVLTQQGFLQAIGRARSAKGNQGSSSGMIPFLAAKNLQYFIDEDLRVRATPFRFTQMRGGTTFAFDATCLTGVCGVYTLALSRGVLSESQKPIANTCRVLQNALTDVGIVALIDEATGYQYVRSTNALAQILEAFIAKELQPWVSTFPPTFYENLFRLRNLEYAPETVKRPQYFGHLTNDLIYRRLAPGVLDELKKVTPKNQSGRRSAKLLQSLTSNVGYPKLKEHLGAVVALMKISKSYPEFKALLDEHYPVYVVENQAALPFDAELDTGEGF